MTSQLVEPGSLVQLGPGQPVMVVSSIVGELAYCYWYEEDQLRDGSFLAGRLRPVEGQRRHWAGAPPEPAHRNRSA